jgi:hypothetical protein
MIGLYCGAHHADARPAGGGRCAECEALVAYASGRLDRCPYGEGKPACSKCPTHCYKPVMRERIRTVMRWAGPRMPLRHPVMAAMHLVDGRRGAPGTAGGSAFSDENRKDRMTT